MSLEYNQSINNTNNRKWPYYLSDQFKRAMTSVVLNISEGNGRQSPKERKRFFNIATASAKESASILPNPDLFVAMYVKKEALLSSQIEGTQASLEGILEFEADLKPKDDINNVKEVMNYISALNYGIKRIQELPLSLRLIREIHEKLLEGVRGGTKNPGEFRRTQDWIGPVGAPLNNATFIPPPPNEVLNLIGELEKFFYAEDSIPLLVKIALIHAQFETIHPFLDGNGRVGRLLITFFLLWKNILCRPLLYLSYYFKKNRQEYYDRLMTVRTEGLWEEWIAFFLQGMIETSNDAILTAKKIIELKENIIANLHEHSIASIFAVKLVDMFFKTPLLGIPEITEQLKISKVSTIKLINKMEKAGLLRELTGKKRYKKYLFKDYVAIIEKGTEL